MSHLLHVAKINTKARPGKLPLMMEFPINPETAPYLVSSSESVRWIPKAHPGDLVRAAVRRDTVLGEFFVEVLQSVREMGAKVEWGNAHPLTEDGLVAALDHVGEYGLGDLSVLAPPNFEAFPIKQVAADHGCIVQPCSWLPEDCVVVVPKDRSFLGFVGLLGARSFVAVVHNASRALGLAWGEADELAAPSPAPVQAD